MKLFGGENDTGFGLRSVLTDVGIRVLLNVAEGNGFADEHTERAMVDADGGRAELLSGVFANHSLQVIIEQTNGSYADILERTDEAVVFKNPAKEAVVLA